MGSPVTREEIFSRYSTHLLAHLSWQLTISRRLSLAAISGGGKHRTVAPQTSTPRRCHSPWTSRRQAIANVHGRARMNAEASPKQVSVTTCAPHSSGSNSKSSGESHGFPPS